VKIAIVGSKPDTRLKAPAGDGWEIWRFGGQARSEPPKADRWFELHRPEWRRGNERFLKDAILFENFPYLALKEEFGPYFFTGGQVSWIFAYAITQKPEMIGLWGINPYKIAHAAQLREIHHFTQVARDRGINVISPADKILQPPLLYGIDILRINADGTHVIRKG
jgi:hypothetical protein